MIVDTFEHEAREAAWIHKYVVTAEPNGPQGWGRGDIYDTAQEAMEVAKRESKAIVELTFMYDDIGWLAWGELVEDYRAATQIG